VFVSSPLTSNQKGAIAEEAIALAATELGIVVCRPNTDARYDLILDCGHRLLRVQCKWAQQRGDVVAVVTGGCWFSPGRGYVRTSYAPTEVDAVAAYCQALDRCFLIPVAAVGGRCIYGLRKLETASERRYTTRLSSPLGL
jgi:hypothetical protein